MPFCQFVDFKESDIKECLYELKLCDEVLKCVCCAFALEKHKQKVVDEILIGIKKIPKQITNIKIPLLPIPANKYYYNFSGIETIVFNTLKTQNEKQIKSLENHKSFLKVFYQTNSLFSLPIIQIEIIFFGRLSSKTIDELWKTLKSDVLFFTGSVGDIEVIDIEGENHLSKLLQIPLLFGYPEFKLEGVLLEHKFSQEQIDEMNYLHTFSLQPLKMQQVVNNNMIDLFEEMKGLILKERIIKEKLLINPDHEIVDDLINHIFSGEINTDNRELEDYLPF